jgi:hypothetical protein
MTAVRGEDVRTPGAQGSPVVDPDQPESEVRVAVKRRRQYAWLESKFAAREPLSAR